jgi:hypothetical protein
MMGTMPWGAELGAIAVVVIICFTYLWRSNNKYQVRIDELRTDYLKEIKEQRIGYEIRMDKKNAQVEGIVEKFNDTINVTLTRVCAERDKEDEMMKSFMNHVKDEHASAQRDHERQESNQKTMAANQERVASILENVLETLKAQLNGSVSHETS